jgi:hypothetical protein
VTRLAEFSPLARLFNLGSFLKKKVAQHFLGYSIHEKWFVLIHINKCCVVLHFGHFFTNNGRSGLISTLLTSLFYFLFFIFYLLIVLLLRQGLSFRVIVFSNDFKPRP